MQCTAWRITQELKIIVKIADEKEKRFSFILQRFHKQILLKQQ